MNKRISVLLLLLLAAMLVWPGGASQAQSAATTVTIIHFSDYHSHAVPFYSEGQPNQGGVARTVAYLKQAKANDKNTLVLSGGDTMNKGVPTWSDEYKCIEWPWFNGLIDYMALGNHDFDYGQDTFKQCQASTNYPIYSANYVGSDGKPILSGSDGKPYIVKEIGGVKLGMFALAGPDFNKLVISSTMTPGSSFSDRIAVAKQIVSTLHNDEKVNAVIFFGHELREDDTALAQQVPGIDLILGTHSHYKSDLIKLPNTDTYFISPFQYLTYLDQTQLTFAGGKLTGVTGKLVKMDSSLPEDPDIKAQVDKLQADLVAKRQDRFAVLGQAQVEMSVDGVDDNETVLGNWAMDSVRKAARTNTFFSTASSFRASIPPGPITIEAFFTAIPYKNSIVTADMTGAQVQQLLDLDVSKKGSDSFLQVSGVRFTMQDGKATNVSIIGDAANPDLGFLPLDPAKTYKIGVTNFMSNVAAGYKDIFATQATNVTDTKRDIGNVLTTTITTAGSITSAKDGRMGVAMQDTSTTPTPMPAMPGTDATPTTAALPPAPTATLIVPSMMPTPTPIVLSPALPRTGSGNDSWLWLLTLATILLAAGLTTTRRRRQAN